ncbi:anaerobic benzoate catabolism transcriptional regulator [compost metagenome]
MTRVSARDDHGRRLQALGSAVRSRRRSLQISQESLALQSGIDRSHMGRIERGERNVTMLNLLRIADALDCKPSVLLASAGM